MTVEQKALVDLIVARDPDEMNETERQRLVSIVAAYLGVPIEHISVVSVTRANSSRVRLEMSPEAAKRLVYDFETRVPMLDSFCQEVGLIRVENGPPIQGWGKVFLLRGEPVFLASDVAQALKVDTRVIVQNIKGNPELFSDRYAFELTPEEATDLRSAGLIPKSGRGGSRALPWAVTRKGAMRLAITTNRPGAFQAIDTFMDAFDEILRQKESHPTFLDELRQQVSDSINGLLNTIVDSKTNATVANALGEFPADEINHLKVWLKRGTIANDAIVAEADQILEQAQYLYDRRQFDAVKDALDVESKTLENLRWRIEVLKAVMALYRKLEPPVMVDVTRSSVAPLPATALPAPPPKGAHDEKDDA
jgi:hypothetical protein